MASMFHLCHLKHTKMCGV